MVAYCSNAALWIQELLEKEDDGTGNEPKAGFDKSVCVCVCVRHPQSKM